MSASALAPHAHPVAGRLDDYDWLLERVADSDVVLLGEASHGSHEFYRERARITERLIDERGFGAVAVEADWPDAYRVNCYVRNANDDTDADEALGDFMRFPIWMWRNHDVREFVEGLRSRNRGRSEPVGFYGLDLYSLHASIEAVLRYLDRADPDAAARARERYGCFGDIADDGQSYGWSRATGASEPCEPEVVAQLLELRERAADLSARDGRLSADAHFFASQNARLVVSAERYYRAMFRGGAESWNLRDRHMAETLEELRRHLDGTKVVVWEHNSHVGDARATEMAWRGGQLNVGQLARERYGDRAYLVGFTTHSGTVSAASDWGGRPETKHVRPALEGSYEQVLHEVGRAAFGLDLQERAVADALTSERLERAIGVIYRPETERVSHWFQARLTEQFNAVIHIDQTRAVEPLTPQPAHRPGEVPETFPSGI